MKKIFIVLLVLSSALTIFADYPRIAVQHPNIGGLFDDAVEYHSSFDPMDGVMAYDFYDGYITDKVNVTGHVDTSTPGKYTLTYSVTSSAGDTKTIERSITVLPDGKFAVVRPEGRTGPNNIIELDDSYINRLADDVTYIRPIVFARPGAVYEFKLLRYKWDLTEDPSNPNVKPGHKNTPPPDEDWNAAKTKEFYKSLFLAIRPRMDLWLKIIVTYNGQTQEWVYGLKGDDGVQFVSTQDGKTYYHLSKEVDDPQTSEYQSKYYKTGSSYWFAGSNTELRRMGSQIKVMTMGSIVNAYDELAGEEVYDLYMTARAFGPGNKNVNTDANWEKIMKAWNHTLSMNQNTSYRRAFQIFFSECKMPKWMPSFEAKYREIRQNYNPERIYVAVSNYGSFSDYKNFYDETSPYFQFEWHKGHFPTMFDRFPIIGSNYHCYSQYPRINEVFSPKNAILAYQTHRDLHALAQQNRISAAIMDKCGFLNKIDGKWIDLAKIYYAMWFCYEGYDYLNNGVFFRDDWDGDGLTNQEEFALDSNPFDADTDGDKVFDADEAAFNMEINDPSDGYSDKDGDRIPNFLEAVLRKATPAIGTGTPAFVPVHIIDANGNKVLINGDNYEDGEWDTDGDLLPTWFEALSNGNPMDLHTYKDGLKGAFIWLIDVAKDYAGMTKMMAYNNDIVGDKDVDDDGISNLDEIVYGLDPNKSADATEDIDGDGVDNITEITNGTSIYGDDNDGPEFFSSIVKLPAFVNSPYSDNLICNTVPPDVGETFTFTKKSGPAWLSISSKGLLSGTPSAGDVGVNTFSVELNGGMGQKVQASFDIEVLGQAQSYTLTVNSGSGDGSYPAGAKIVITADEAPSGQVFKNWEGDTQNVNDIYNPDSFVIMPGADVSITAAFTAEPNSNVAPFANDDFYNVNFNKTLSVRAPGFMSNDSDANGDSMTAQKQTNPTHGNLNFNADGSFIYIPDNDFVGADSFTYKLSDGHSESLVATVFLNVVNKSPIAVDDAYSLVMDKSINISADGVLKNDKDKENDQLSAVLEASTTHGQLTLNSDGSFLYTPNSGYTGGDSFTYKISDPFSSSVNAATVTLTINSAGTEVKPIAINDQYSVNQGEVLNIQAPGLLDNDTDISGTGITAVQAHYPIHGVLNLHSDGSFSYTPAAGYSGEDSFTYRVAGSTKTSDIATVSITVKANHVPQYTLTVNNGTGSGQYAENVVVNISATPPNGQVFDKWTGDTQYVNDVNAASTTVNMPAQDVTVTATFKQAPPNTHNITGTVSGAVQQGVAVSVDASHSATTDASGNYTIGGLADGTYTVTPTLAGYTFAPATASVTVSGADATGVNFTSTQNTAPKFTLTVNNGTGGGQYAENDSATISATVPAGQIFDAWTGDTQYLADASAASTTVTMPAQDVSVTATFKQAPPNTHTISGTVSGDIKQGIAVAVDSTHSATTDASGNYTISGLVDGTYTVTPTLAGYTFAPATASATVAGADVTGIDFTSTTSGGGGGITDPTDIAGCNLWLDGADPKGDGSAVTGALDAWKNKADTSNFAYQVDGAKQPEVVANALNGLSLLRFTGGDQSYPIVDSSLGGTSISNISTIFWVIKESSTLAADTCPFFLGNSGTSVFHRGIGDANAGYAFDGKYWDDDYASDEVKNGQTYLDGTAVSGTNDVFPAGDYHIVSLVLAGPVEVDSITQDRNGAYGLRSWQGDIAEIITYTSALSDADRQSVEAYLNAKWFGSAPATYTISGTITGDVTSGVTVSAGGKSAVSGASGNYTISGLADGTYTVTPSLSGYTFAPASQSAIISGADVTGINFTSTTSGGGGGITDPTDIAGCNLWLDGADPKGDGSAVTGALDAWKNKADTSNFAYQVDGTKQAEVVANALNGLSLLRFTGGDQSYPIVDSSLGGTSISNISTIFWVIKESSSLAADTCPFFLGNSGTSVFHRGIGDANAGYAFDGKYWDDDYASDEVKNGQTYLDGAAVSGTNDVFPAGDYHIVSLVLTGPVEVDSITQDRNGVYGLRSWQGDIAEIITYTSALSDADRQSVEAYLNAKWFGTIPTTHTISGTISGDVQAGVTVLAGGKSALSAADGTYTISGLADGTYTVTPTLTGYTFTPATASATVSGADVTGIDFTSAQNSAPQFTLTVNNGTGGGQYAENDSVTISATVPAGQVFNGWTGDTQYLADQNAASTIVTMPAQNVTVTATFKQAPPNTHNISGTVTGDIRQGVTVAVDPTHSATTDASGNYTISGLTDGTYTVTPSLTGYTFAPATASATVSGADVTGVNFVSTQNAAPQFTLTVNNGTGSGQYAQGDIANISATVPAGKVFNSWTGDTQYIANTSVTSTTVSMPAQNVTVTATFDDAPAGTYNISGTITGDVHAGVTVAVDTTHSATTDVSGNYTISGLADGTYTVTPSLSGYTFNPATASATVSGANVTGIDFIATADVVNNSPVAKNDSFNVKVDTMLTVNKPGVLANDYDLENAQLTAFIVTQTTNGTLTFVNDGSFSYQPNNGFTGTDSFTYKVSDGELDSNTATVTLTVYNANTNIPPNALDDDYAMATNSELTVDAESGVLANDTDLNDADTLTAEIGTMPLQGTLVFNADGSFTYTPEEDFVGIVEFTYTALDNNGARSGVATVQIDVKPFNITIGSPVTVLATEVLTDEKFVKIPKIYGMVDGKKASLKKLKSQFTPDKAVGIWSRKVTLYDKKALKNGYAAYFENGDPQKPKNIQIKVKMKTQAKEKIDVDVKVAMLVPPVFESFQIKDDIITEASAGASIIINGKYFGEKIPKVALVIDNKLVKCKVDKKALIYKNYKGKPSPMEPETGISRLTVVLPVKKVNPGTYDVIIDNKIGIATDANEALPKIIIK